MTETTKAIEVARSRTNTREMDNYLDNKRRDFLTRLSASSLRRKLADWELHFVNDLVIEPRPFDDVQHDTIDKLRRLLPSLC